MPLQSNVKELIKQGDRLFDRPHFMSLCQELAENFYPERADFTVTRGITETLTSNLSTSYPILARRDLANTIGAMLRPRNKSWMKHNIRGRDNINETERSYLEYLADIQRRAMYERNARFIRSTTQGDNDWATFGQAVFTVEVNRNELPPVLLYRNWHLRDVAWGETHDGRTIPIHRKAKPTAQQLVSEFKNRKGATLHANVLDAYEKDPYREFDVRHIVIDAESYEGEKKWRAPFVSIWIDVGNEHIIMEEPSQTRKYVIPRWATVSGSQYAYSPASVIALPDARLIQSMTWVLLKSGEMCVDPPMVGKEGVVRSDVGLFPGGITWVDSEYDERLGSALRALEVDRSSVKIGADMREEIKQILSEAFFLNKISLPSVEMSGQMTAFEIGQRVQEYVRQAMPLFEPMEIEYNGALCEETFNVMMNAGMFGRMSEMPETLAGEDIEFVFSSPISDTVGKEKGQKLLEMKQMLAQVADVDQETMMIPDFKQAFRDALEGSDVPAKWIHTAEEVQAAQEQRARMQQAQALMAQMSQGAQVAKDIGEAGQSLRQMQAA